MKQIFFLAVACMFYVTGYTQTAISPLDVPIYLSGNFGELRPNHFHSGIDFKTQGKTGLPIKSIKKGYIARISVSPSGYGRVLYVNHPDGTTTVYAHLERFARNIETFTVDSQYIKQSFAIDMDIAPDKFPVKEGEVIAYSGNTGSSAGPHLHFELRETSTQNAHDPMMLYLTKIKDNLKPQLQALMAYPEKGAGVVNGNSGKLQIAIKKDKSGKESISPAIKVWGKVGFGIKTTDYMNDTHNSFGVKDIQLQVDDTIVFRSIMSSFAFSETRYINSFIDWEEWIGKKSYFIKSFVDPGNDLSLYQSDRSGIFDFNEERDYRLVYTLKDVHGNTSVFAFTAKGEKQTITPYQPSGTLFPCNQDNSYVKNDVSLEIPKGNLYTDIYFNASETNTSYTPFTPLFRMYERMPLHSYCSLTIPIRKDNFPIKEKYGVVSYNSGQKAWIGGTYDNGKMNARIRELGSFSVDIDTIAPVVTALNRPQWTKTKKISFKITDELSGISSWTGTIDGKFILFELDAKRALLFCEYDPQRMKAGAGKLRLVVRDACGNEGIFEEAISW